MRDPDPEKLDAFVGRLVGEAGAAVTGALIVLGAQAGETRLRQVAREAGHSRFRRAAEPPFTIVFEVRPWRPLVSA